MKAKLFKITFAMICGLIGIVKSIAALAAGGASYCGIYQRKVPERLCK